METLNKRNGLLPSMMMKSVDNFFDDFLVKESFDSTDKNFVELSNKLRSVNFNEINTNIKVEIDNDALMINSYASSSSDDLRKKDDFIGIEFNYRSFCRLPNH